MMPATPNIQFAEPVITMKNKLLSLPLLLISLVQLAQAADQAVPMIDFEPRPASASDATSMDPGAFASMLDDFAQGHQSAPRLPAAPFPEAGDSLDNEYRGASRVAPELRDF